MCCILALGFAVYLCLVIVTFLKYRERIDCYLDAVIVCVGEMFVAKVLTAAAVAAQTALAATLTRVDYPNNATSKALMFVFSLPVPTPVLDCVNMIFVKGISTSPTTSSPSPLSSW